MKRAAVLVLLPAPILLVSISIPKLSGLYDQPAFFLPLAAALAGSAAAIVASSARAVRGPGGLARGAWLGAISVAAGLVALLIYRTNPHRLAALREVVHIIEYGAIAAGALWILRPVLHGRLGYAATLGYVSCVGVVDELVQFYHPARVGDLRDVLTDLGAGCLGILLANRVHGVAFAPDPTARSALFAAAMATTAAGLVVLFFALVETGYALHDPSFGTFRSRLAPATLQARARGGAGGLRQRQQRESLKPVFALEDLYLSEGRAHIIHRDALGTPPRQVAAENAILEAHFGPVLDALDARRGSTPRADDLSTYHSPYLKHLRTRPGRPILVVLAAALMALGAGILLRTLG